MEFIAMAREEFTMGDYIVLKEKAKQEKKPYLI